VVLKHGVNPIRKLGALLVLQLEQTGANEIKVIEEICTILQCFFTHFGALIFEDVTKAYMLRCVGQCIWSMVEGMSSGKQSLSNFLTVRLLCKLGVSSNVG
jgi:hypothetical protein